MTIAAPLAGVQRADPHIVKQWAAEDFAIAMGFLCECPYHGQPFRTRRKGLMTSAIAAGLIDPLDPNVQVFNGDTQELLAAVERVTGDYGERCELCAASDQEEFD
jgi:hypothetical protein